MTKKTITLYTMSYNNYWEKYGQQWSLCINNLNTPPDEIIIVSDVALDLSILKNKNVKNIISPIVEGRRMVSPYRNIAIESASCDWVVSADIDDVYADVFLDNLPEDSDIHAFKFYDSISEKTYIADENSLEHRLYGVVGDNLIPGCSAIKKHVFDLLKYEDNCHEDKIFYAMASQLNLKVSSDSIDFPPRFYYNGWHSDDTELKRVTKIYIDFLIKGSADVYAFWFSENMSDNRFKALIKLYKSCPNLKLLNLEEFYKFNNKQLPIHEGFKYLTDHHKSDYARAYMMYFYGGGYSDVKANEFKWDPYFKELFYSRFDANGYANNSKIQIPKLYNNLEAQSDVENNFDRFMGFGHFIFKPKTYFAYKWITEIHKKMDESYEQLSKGLVVSVHNTHPDYQETIKDYPFHWSEIGGVVLLKLQYENNFENIILSMPFTNIKDYL
jgi:hypothetical protein